MFNINSNNCSFIWIKIALLNKCLMEIVELIIENSNKFYMPFGLIADPFDGSLFCSLLIGPCTLDVTRIKSVNDFWSDPNADELINRYNLSNISNYLEPLSILMYEKISPTKAVINNNKQIISNHKDYVESIHQNNKSQLIYGKNNVLVNQVYYFKIEKILE